MARSKKPINENFVVFGRRLRELRESLGLTQAEFAEKTGCTQTTLSAYENSLKVPSLDIVMGIASECKVSIDWLCGLSESQNLDGSVKTYSDIIRLLWTVMENTSCHIHSSNLELYAEAFPHRPESIPLFSLTFLDDRLSSFLANLDKVKRLQESGTFDKEMTDIWIEKNLRNNLKEINSKGDYSLTEIYNLDDLPF